ncbi:hypothetical protein AMAG_02097 [Allomyces macrogynus ATCC 38327]|uniref:Rap-GAP domain-containing protein n=1 Tax=Allomyces macrogynus (strain ATCC 38327) TaxID=578462 RepID=A0A0L0S143_ALLM3|nr:hypothetical protein AMAG_02097 [Allomyces macrogynus ATCC 38327]|eukprot:KNE56268.1 hypothetical protein AMAG_02097 [Allomyces macrogynus ATCC 38327]
MPLPRRETPAPVPHAGTHALPSALTGMPRTHAATACAGCGETIMAFEPYFAFDAMIYHQKCFNCSRCHRPLAMDNVLAFNGDIFCTKHNPAAGPPPAPLSSASTAKRFFFRRPASFLTKSASAVTNAPPPPVPAQVPRHAETVVSPTLSSASAHVHWDPEATYAAPFAQITRRLSPVATDRAAAPPSITGVSPSIMGASPPGRATPGSTHTSSTSSSSSLSWSRRYRTHASTAAAAAAAAEPPGLPTVAPLSTSRPTSPLSQPWDEDDHVPHPRMNVEDDAHPLGPSQTRARAGSASNLRSRFPSAASVSAVSLISLFQKSGGGGAGSGKDSPATPAPYPDYDDEDGDEDDEFDGHNGDDDDDEEDDDVHDDDGHHHRRRHRHSHHPHLARTDTLPSPPVDARYTPPNTYAPSALAASSLVGAVGTGSGTRLPDPCPTPPDPSPSASPRTAVSTGGDFKRLPPRSTSFAFGTAPSAHPHARTLPGVDEGDDDDENEYDTSAVPVAGDDGDLPPRPPRDPDHVLARHLARMALGHPGAAGVHGADPAALKASSPTRATVGIVARRSITRSRSQDLDVVGDEVAAAVAAPQRRAQFTHLKKQRAQSMGAVASIWTAGAAPALPDLIYRTDGFVVETPPPRAVPIFGMAPASAPLAGPPQEDWGMAIRPPPLPTSPQIAHEFVSSAASVASVHSNGGGSVVSQATAAAAESVSARSPHASVRSRGTNPYLVSDARLNAMLVDYAHVEYSPYPGAPPTLLDQVDVTAMYYRQYFAGHDHNNYVMVLDGAQGGSSGVAGAISAAMSMGGGSGSGNAASALDDGLTGPLVISVRHDVAAGVFRMLVRSEDRDVRIEVPVSEVKARVKRHKDVIKYVYQRFPVHKLVKVRAKSLEADLVKLDQMRLAFGVKVGVLYMRRGQTDENDVFGNQTHSRAFDEFLDVLGDRVPLVGYQGFLGGLDNRHGLDGPESVVGKCGHFDLMFHVSTLLPYSPTDPQQVQRKAKIGNDLVCVVYVDDFVPPPALAGADAHRVAALADLAQVAPVFDPTMIQSHFLTVYLVVAPCVMDGVAGHRVAVVAQADVPSFGPPLPPDGFFGDATQLRHFLHAKIVNGEAAAFRAGKIARLHRRTREMMVRDLVTTLVKYGGYDKPNATKNAKDDSCGDASDAVAANASPQPTRGSRGRGAVSEKPGDASALPPPPSTSRRGKSRFRTQARQSVAPGAGDLATLENPSAVTVTFPTEPADAVTSPTLATAVPAAAPPVGSPPRPRGRGFFAAMLRRNPGAGNSASASPPAPANAAFVPETQYDGGGAA